MSLPSESMRKQAAMRDFIWTVGKGLAEAKIAHLVTGEGLEDENKDILSYLSESVFACYSTLVDLLIHCLLKVKTSYKEGQSLDVDELMDHVSVMFHFYHPIPNALSRSLHLCMSCIMMEMCS